MHMCCPCLYYVNLYTVQYGETTLQSNRNQRGKTKRHAFAQQPLAGFAPTKHRGEMLCRCFAGLRALGDGKKPRSVV